MAKAPKKDVVTSDLHDTPADGVEKEAVELVADGELHEAKLAGAPADPAPAETPKLDGEGLVYGIVCVECGRFIEDPMGEIIIGRCSTCGGKITRALRRDVKEIVNSERASRGLSPLF